MRKFGLIGLSLKHSFSKSFFESKFQNESIHDVEYNLYELENISLFTDLVKNEPSLIGLNVTIPYKTTILPYLEHVDEPARLIGAVNVLKRQKNGNWIGYNSDYYGFKLSLLNFLDGSLPKKALILGTGGSSKTVSKVLDDLAIEFILVSRNPATLNSISYENTKEILKNSSILIINTSPAGMHPNINQYPDIDYSLINESNYVFDLVYNPDETLFLQKAKVRGAKVKNGLEMLHLQAEKSWEIWNADII